MNPNLAQNLDPKLKETYDRVMGTQLNPQPAQKTQPAPKPAQPVQEVHLPQTPPPTAPEPTLQKEPEVEMVNINGTVSVAKPAAVSKKKSSLVVFIAAGIGFLLLYTIIWFKVFKIF